MGIEILATPGAKQGSAGPFTLPTTFDQKKWAAMWAKGGNEALAAGEREHLIGTQLTADGWSVWKDGEGQIKGKPHSTRVASGEYILLCRPREVQDAVNAIYGNVGYERMSAEKTGETTGGVPINDPGLLSEERLNRVIGRDELTEGQITMNQIPNVRRVSTSELDVNSPA